MSRRRSRREPQETDFFLNIVPIVDCLTILLTFLLASGAFISLGALEIGMAGGTDSVENVGEKPPVNIRVRMNKKVGFAVRVSGKERASFELARLKSKSWNHSGLNERLEVLKEKWPNVKGVTLEADQNIQYEDVVLAMETIKRSHPEVLLGGF